MKKHLLTAAALLGLAAMTFAQNEYQFSVRIKSTGVVEGVPVSSDDAEQENDAMDKLYDDDLDAGWEGDDQNIMVTGMRFRDVYVPKGATITEAYIEVYAHEEETDEARITIVGEASDFAETYDLDNLITDRPETNASVEWTVTESWDIWTMYQTADISSVVQEIIDRPGWKVGNPVAVMLKGEDQGVNTEDNARDMESFENEEDPEDGGDGRNHPLRAPRLVVKYTNDNMVFSRQIFKTGFVEGVAVSSDDAEQENDAMDKIYDDDLDAGWEGDDQNIMVTGMRFRDIMIPPGSTIDSAWVEVYAHEEETDEARITIVGEASDNTETYDLDNLITDRPETAASVNWSVTEPWAIWTRYRTVDIAPIIQEIVDRPGWEYYNALSLMFKGEDQGVNTEDNARDMESFENEEDPEDGGDGMNHPERAPRLVVWGKFSTDGFDYVGVDDNQVAGLTIYPNPVSNGILYIRTDATDVKNASVAVYDVAGRKVLSSVTSADGSVNVSTLEEGLYILQVNSENEVVVNRFIVE
mgnify:CR=1 FL=1